MYRESEPAWTGLGVYSIGSRVKLVSDVPNIAEYVGIATEASKNKVAVTGQSSASALLEQF